LTCGEAGGLGHRVHGPGDVGISQDKGGIFSAKFECQIFGGVEGREF
jgi:hypothetical protein